MTTTRTARTTADDHDEDGDATADDDDEAPTRTADDENQSKPQQTKAKHSKPNKADKSHRSNVPNHYLGSRWDNLYHFLDQLFCPCFGPFLLPPVVAGGWWCVVVGGGCVWWFHSNLSLKLCIQTSPSNFAFKICTACFAYLN